MDATPALVPIAVTECPFCHWGIGVQLHAKAPVALPAGPGQPAAAPPGCCSCPKCGRPLYPKLSAVPPPAPPASSTDIGLVPRGDTTRRM